MCTLHLFFQIFDEAPVLFAANRDELLARPWAPPSFLEQDPWIFGPRDVLAGGTWLGVNAGGVLVGLANHEGTLSRPQTPSYCSRGAVVLETLRRTTAEEAAEFSAAAAPACKSYTLLTADPDGAFVVERTPHGTSLHRLAPGCHVITNARFRDPRDPRARRVLRRMGDLVSRGRVPTAEDLRQLLADHEVDDDAAKPVCVHPKDTPPFGTSSASAVRIGADRCVASFLFASGPPCTTPFSAFSLRAPEPRDGDEDDAICSSSRECP